MLVIIHTITYKGLAQKNSTEKNFYGTSYAKNFGKNSADEKGFNVDRLADAITPISGLGFRRNP